MPPARAAFSLLCPTWCVWTNLVHHSIDVHTCMSSTCTWSVEKYSMKPNRGIEPLGHKLTRLVSLQASGCRKFYNVLLSGICKAVISISISRRGVL